VTISPGYDDWAARVGQPFTVAFDADRSAELVLSHCSDAVVAGGIRSFSLLFTAESDVPADQGTFRFSAPGFDTTDVFVVPLRSDQAGTEFEAVFNQVEE
jgi:hypothetical protein